MRAGVSVGLAQVRAHVCKFVLEGAELAAVVAVVD